mmetsp:Transcript_51089/g.121384  ORF Transcript_51089/g.121384 Transcript_51089/m.121384 type:complete len:218 (-) Transcript_51089:2-655(-)
MPDRVPGPSPFKVAIKLVYSSSSSSWPLSESLLILKGPSKSPRLDFSFSLVLSSIRHVPSSLPGPTSITRLNFSRFVSTGCFSQPTSLSPALRSVRCGRSESWDAAPMETPTRRPPLLRDRLPPLLRDRQLKDTTGSICANTPRSTRPRSDCRPLRPLAARSCCCHLWQRELDEVLEAASLPERTAKRGGRPRWPAHILKSASRSTSSRHYDNLARQ